MPLLQRYRSNAQQQQKSYQSLCIRVKGDELRVIGQFPVSALIRHRLVPTVLKIYSRRKSDWAKVVEAARGLAMEFVAPHPTHNISGFSLVEVVCVQERSTDIEREIFTSPIRTRTRVGKLVGDLRRLPLQRFSKERRA